MLIVCLVRRIANIPRLKERRIQWPLLRTDIHKLFDLDCYTDLTAGYGRFWQW